jgi:N-dimethylarginine dimethylaminohydrolase
MTASTPRETIFVGSPSCDSHTCPTLSPQCQFKVAWQINPHMKLNAVDSRRACAQHAAFVQTLRALGADVATLPFVHAAYDSVFVKDAGLLVEGAALVARPRYFERRREQPARATSYSEQGLDVVYDFSCPTWEAGDTVMLPNRAGLLLGHGFRSDAAAAPWLARHTELDVHALELRDPRLFHLDMALAVLPDGTALVCEDALTTASVRALRGIAGIERVQAVSIEDALAFGLNFVVVGDSVVIGARVPSVEKIARARGYTPVYVDVSQFHLAGGGVACLTSRLHTFDAAEAWPMALSA